MSWAHLAEPKSARSSIKARPLPPPGVVPSAAEADVMREQFEFLMAHVATHRAEFYQCETCKRYLQVRHFMMGVIFK
jgi:hypothetical protein